LVVGSADALEQAALAQCSVFEGGFTLEAAEAVLDLSRWAEAPSALDAIQALVDKSLLRTWVPAAQGRYAIDEPYFGMYVSIHEYASGKLDASEPGARRRAEERHGRYFARFGTEEALEALFRQGGVRRSRLLALELDNLVAACRRAVARKDGAIAVRTYCAAWEALDLQGPYALAVALGAQVLALDEIAASPRAATLAARALASQRAGRIEEAESGFERALTLAREIGDRHREWAVLLDLGNLRRMQGRMEEARDHLETALIIAREAGNRRGEGMALAVLGNLHNDQGRIEESQAHFEAALAIHREVGNRRGEGSLSLGVLYAEQGRLEEARAALEQCLAIRLEIGDRVAEGEVLTNLGCLCQEQGRMKEAQAHFETALSMHRAVGNRRYEGYVLGDLGRLHLEQGNWTASRDCLDQALHINREIGDKRIEGSELRSLGDLFIQQGRIDEARAALAAGEAVLRQVGDKFYLGYVLCSRAEVERLTGDFFAARVSLRGAESLAAETLAGPDSELGRKIAKLRQALE
jgi:tetratricopeptide (TPR) repeat protein